MEAIKDKDYGKSPMKFPDYESTESGLQYKDLREGSGAQPRDGDTCVIDWDGYTVGYYGRVFEARNKVRPCRHPPCATTATRLRRAARCAPAATPPVTQNGEPACSPAHILPPARSAHGHLGPHVQPKGSSFEGNDKDYVRLKLGSANIIPGVEEALRGMRVGGVRRVIVPEQLGYPNADFKKWAPSPTTFSVRSRAAHAAQPTTF